MKLASNSLFRLAPLFACATLASAQSGHSPDRLIPGTLYETTTTTASSILSGAGMSSRTRMIEALGKVRSEVLEGSGPAAMAAQPNPMQGGPGSYLLTLPGPHTYSVDTVKREYFEINVKTMLAKGSDMMKGLGDMNLKISDQKVDAVDMGDGGVILGHPTNHWRLRQTMTMTANMMGDTMAASSEMTTDMYYARDLESVTSSSPLDSTMFNQLRGFAPLIDVKKTAAAYAKLPRKMPLKTVQKGLTVMGPMEVTINSTTEVTKIQKGRFSEALFRVPKGYKLVEMPFPKMPDMSAPER